jgi:hypothetical protein
VISRFAAALLKASLRAEVKNLAVASGLTIRGSTHTSDDLDLVSVRVVDVEGFNRQKRMLAATHLEAKLAKSNPLRI